jgi:hypothetical protein
MTNDLETIGYRRVTDLSTTDTSAPLNIQQITLPVKVFNDAIVAIQK